MCATLWGFSSSTCVKELRLWMLVGVCGGGGMIYEMVVAFGYGWHVGLFGSLCRCIYIHSSFLYLPKAT